jgi:hypothetical protein
MSTNERTVVVTDSVERVFSVSYSIQPLYGQVPDPGWRYTDPAGHLHTYVEGKDVDHYPTLVRQSGWVDGVPDDDTDDETADDDNDDRYRYHWYACRLCGAVVRPREKPGVYYVPGQVEYTIDGVPVYKSDYDRLLAEAVAGLTPPESPASGA